jgi:hypothetical protein
VEESASARKSEREARQSSGRARYLGAEFHSDHVIVGVLAVLVVKELSRLNSDSQLGVSRLGYISSVTIFTMLKLTKKTMTRSPASMCTLECSMASECFCMTTQGDENAVDIDL